MRAGAKAAKRTPEAINKAAFMEAILLCKIDRSKRGQNKTPNAYEPVASETHFLVKLVCAAPCNFCAAA
jgi:hypothetical protein